MSDLVKELTNVQPDWYGNFVCQWLSVWSIGGIDEGHMARWAQDRTIWYKLIIRGRRIMSGIPRTPYPSMEVESSCLGLHFCIGNRMTYLLRKRSTGACNVTFWGKTSFPQSAQGRQNVAGSSSMTLPPNTSPGQLRSGCVRNILSSWSWNSLASLQTSTE